jgi:hypothetical protein
MNEDSAKYLQGINCLQLILTEKTDFFLGRETH